MSSKCVGIAGAMMLRHVRICGCTAIHIARFSEAAISRTNFLQQETSLRKRYLLSICVPATSKTFLSSQSNQRPSIPNVEYEEIKALPGHPDKLLIDVREPKELVETGVIPTSINIPLESVSSLLAADVKPQIFQKKYGRSKPTEDTEIIFTCRSGKRALKAAEIAYAMGFVCSKYYGGSWEDWAEKEKQIK